MITATEDDKFGLDFLDNIAEWIGENLEPEDVFSATQLRDWALDNGFEAKENDYRYTIGGTE